MPTICLIGNVTVEVIIGLVSQEFNASVAAIRRQISDPNGQIARQVVMYLSKKHTSNSDDAIARQIGACDGYMVKYGASQVLKLRNRNPRFDRQIQTIERVIEKL